MTKSGASLKDLADAHGVHSDYYDLNGTRHQTSPETMRALLFALGVDCTSDALIADAFQGHRAEQSNRILPTEIIAQTGIERDIIVRQPCDWVLTTEDGKQVGEGRSENAVTLPALPVGYYVLVAIAGPISQRSHILVRPVHAPRVEAKTGRAQCWGMTGALFGLRSERNGGLGNYEDLAVVCAALGNAKSEFFGVNPIHTLGWAAGKMISPYSPTHRGFFNIDHIASAQGLGPSPSMDLIDYETFRSSHRIALQAEFNVFETTVSRDEFADWQATQGINLDGFTQFEALSEKHGPDFRKWPAALRKPGKASIDAAGARVTFHAWLQWRAETQIAKAQCDAIDAGMGLGLYLDLAVGSRPGGAEVWMNEATIAKGVTIGAPPDHLSPEGQSWALAAHAPAPLAASFYAPFRAMLRKLMKHSGLLRIDHALGLLRSFWLPDDGSPGGYISQPLDAFLAVIMIEAELSGCVIVGEDLGLVPDGFREKLVSAGLYSYSVWQYETFHDGRIRSPDTLSANSLACFGTHDTPTLQGFWYGEDISWWQHVGWSDDNEVKARHSQRARQRQSLRELCKVDPMASAGSIGNAIQNTLADAPCALMAVQLDDALALSDAQNLPGTIDEHPNWRRRLPIGVEEFDQNEDIQSISDMMINKRSAPLKSTKLA
jgi:4-alpha-glucanotransferase